MIHSRMAAARKRVDSGIFATAKVSNGSDELPSIHGSAQPDLRTDGRADQTMRTSVAPPISERELTDVPAAVVCAFCGQSECMGCDREETASGIIAVVAWERTAMPFTDRLWATSRATTRDAETFFSLLPDGSVWPAISFALIAESIAVASFAVLLFGLACLIAWPLVSVLLTDPATASLFARGVALGIPSIVIVLVLAHVVHGLFIDVGATRAGKRGARRRAIRFGLYAAGWDLVMAPAGLLLALVKEGFRFVPEYRRMLYGLPTRSSKALLAGTYGILGDAQKAPLSFATMGAVVATAFGALFVFGIVAACMIF